MNKRKRKRKGEGDCRPERKREKKRGRKKEKEKKKKRMGLRPPLFLILYRLLSHLCVFHSIYLVRNLLPVDVGIVVRITSNIVFIVVFSLPQACVSSD